MVTGPVLVYIGLMDPISTGAQSGLCMLTDDDSCDVAGHLAKSGIRNVPRDERQYGLQCHIVSTRQGDSQPIPLYQLLNQSESDRRSNVLEDQDQLCESAIAT